MDVNYWLLAGVLIIVVGITAKQNILLVVLVSGFLTGLIGHLNPLELLKVLGQAFTQNRYMSVFIAILPVIGILERHGLRQSAERLMGRSQKLGVAGVWLIYALIRSITLAFGIIVGGHPSTVRPILEPMASGALGKGTPLPEPIREKVKAFSALTENVSNFFSQNLFIAAGGVLLIKGVLQSAGYTASVEGLALYALFLYLVFLVIFGFFAYGMEKHLQKQLRIFQQDQKN